MTQSNDKGELALRSTSKPKRKSPAASRPRRRKWMDRLFGSAKSTEPNTERIWRQREEARAQRDVARSQRDRVRAEQDELGRKLASLQSELDAIKRESKTPFAKVAAELELAARALGSASSSVQAIRKTVKKAEASTSEVVGQAFASYESISNARRRLKSTADGKLTQLVLDRFALLRSGDHFSAERERAHKRLSAIAKLERGERLSTTEQETLARRRVPDLADAPSNRVTPPASVLFVTATNARFFKGTEALLCSLLDVYPGLRSPFHVYHDGSLTEFSKRRLLSLYPRCAFHEDTMAWMRPDVAADADSKSARGLGFLSANVLHHDEGSHVVFLSSDVMIWGDISEYWSSDTEACVCHDAGVREYAAFSDATQDYILNTGIVSLPRDLLGPDAFSEMASIMRDIEAKVCPLLDRFSDQKAWNLFLARRSKRVLPLNYNCNVKFVTNHLDGNIEGLRVIRFTGAKPWLTKDYVPEEFLSTKSDATTYHDLWQERYRGITYRRRLEQFREHLPSNRSTPVRAADEQQPTCILIGNGPSIRNTDLSAVRAAESFCFNWFVLHEAFDEIRPQHLVLASHMFFGGWNTPDPRFPEGYLEALRSKTHRPAIWTSFYFKPFFESLGLDREFEVNYLLFEKPFKRFVDRVGRATLNIDGFLKDGRTGVLSFGVPIARHLGFRRIVLVGCDSNYNRTTTDSNYFYDPKLHTSASTRSDSLTSTWAPEGAGPFVYSVVRAQLEAEGVEFLDATVDGALQVLPKVSLADVFGRRGGRVSAAEPPREGTAVDDAVRTEQLAAE